MAFPSSTTKAIAPPTVQEFRQRLAAWIAAHGDELEPFRKLRPPVIDDVYEQERALQRMLFEAGWTRWGWPESAGGFGGTAVLRAALYEQLTMASIRLPEAFYLLETLAPMLVEFEPSLADAYLMSFVSGDELWCQGFSEPDAGSDLASLRCRAVAAGDRYLISGQKIWTTLGHLAQRCALLVRTGDGRHGLSMFLVDLGVPGLTVRPLRAMSGRDEFAEVFFDEVEVPAGRLVGSVGQGWSIAMYLLQWERGMYAWMRQAMLHAELTRQIREPGTDLSASNVGEAYELLSALRQRCDGSVQRLARGENPGPEISIEKVLLSTAEQCVLDLARRNHFPSFELGGDPGSDVLRSDWCYSRASSIFGGAVDVQRNILAKRVLGLPVQ